MQDGTAHVGLATPPQQTSPVFTIEANQGPGHPTLAAEAHGGIEIYGCMAGACIAVDQRKRAIWQCSRPMDRALF